MWAYVGEFIFWYVGDALNLVEFGHNPDSSAVMTTMPQVSLYAPEKLLRNQLPVFDLVSSSVRTKSRNTIRAQFIG